MFGTRLIVLKIQKFKNLNFVETSKKRPLPDLFNHQLSLIPTGGFSLKGVEGHVLNFREKMLPYKLSTQLLGFDEKMWKEIP